MSEQQYESTREKVLERVTKLLAMAKHSASNEHEASTALRRAESLMRQHAIEFAELEASKLDQGDMIKAETEESRNSKWVWTLAWSSSYLTSTLPTKRNGLIQFCGTKEDTQVALLMFDYLVSVTERLARQFDGDRSERNSFKVGVAVAITTRARTIRDEREADLRSATSTGKDLVLLKQDMIKSQFGLVYRSAGATRVGNMSAYSAGYAKGRGVSLNQQVNGTRRNMIAS